MSIQKGKTNLTVYRIESNPYSSAEELLGAVVKHAAPPLSEAAARPDGDSIGWTSGKVLLDGQITLENSLIENKIVLNVRTTKKRIDSGLLKAVCQREEAAYLKVNNSEFVPRKVRKEIKADAVERLKKDATLGVHGVEVVIDGDKLLIGATSTKDCDLVTTLLLKNLDIAAIQPRHTNARGESFTAGREFLTWLHKKILMDGTAMLPGIDVMIEGPLDLIAEGDARCTVANLKGALVTESAEVREALNDKKQISKARLALTKNNDIWHFTFNADEWTFGSLELPKSCENFSTRVEAILELYNELDAVFNTWKNAEQVAGGEQDLPGMEGK